MLPQKHSETHYLWILMPLFGILTYVLLFYLATLLYPGGSNADPYAQGFNWIHNYWCDLLGPGAKNGQLNPARPLALVAMLLLCASLAMFWYLLPGLFPTRKTWPRLIRIAGITSMLLAFFVFTSYHDLVVYAAGILGLVAIVATAIGLYRAHVRSLLWLGLFCLVLVLVNNYIYRSGQYITALPVIQKFSFFIFFLWVILLDIALFRKKSGI